MHINQLNLKNFRNYTSTNVSFSPGVNFIMGDNGVGKSNILEAISILSNVKSFRNIADNEIIQWNHSSYFVSAEVTDQKESARFEIGCAIEEDKVRKKVKLGGKEVAKVSDYYGKLLTVIFSPIDINIINGAPDIRRKFFDSVISKLDPIYMDTLGEFKKVIVARNRLLKMLRERKINDVRQLDPWDTLFAEKASLIISRRIAFVERFDEIFRKAYGRIAQRDQSPVITYEKNIRAVAQQDIYRELMERRTRDVMTGATGVGPQRDDFILSNLDKILFTNYASQGQRRTAAIALKIAEGEIIEEQLKKKSVILVDDIFSELDESRRKNMVDVLSSGNQVIFTMVNSNSVNISDFPGSRHYTVSADASIIETK